MNLMYVKIVIVFRRWFIWLALYTFKRRKDAIFLITVKFISTYSYI